MIEIKNRFTGETIIAGDYQTHLEAIVAYVQQGKNLYGVDLRGADLRDVNLYGADLYGADLYGANLDGADLREASLRGADLRGADLRDVNLYGADLRGADLRDANLYGVDLRGVDLRGANLDCADLGDSFVTFGPFGTQNQMTYFDAKNDEVRSGCWSGSLEEFRAKVAELFAEKPKLRTLFEGGIALCEAAKKAQEL